MALTSDERNLLDKLMTKRINECIEEKKKSFTLNEFFEYLEENKFPATITGRSISPCLERLPYDLRKDNRIYYENKTIKITHYDYTLDSNYNFTKEKNLLYFNDEKTLYYDFITKKFNAPKNSIKLVNFYNSPIDVYKNCFKYEWLFNYCDNLRTIDGILRNSNYSNIDISVMPAGLYKYLTDNSLRLDYEVLRNYLYISKYGNKYYKFVKSIGASEKCIDFYLKDKKVESLVKMAQLSLLNGCYSVYDLGDFISLYYEICNKFDNIIIDTNRDLKYNIKLLEDIKNKERNEKLAKQLQRLNFIHNMKIDDYVVIVPQSQADKQAEGKMQNNCVGRYYDDSILKGENLIYFIRKSTNLDKSYITCRYNIKKQNTVEARKVNNTSINNSKETEIIKQISEIIKENLK